MRKHDRLFRSSITWGIAGVAGGLIGSFYSEFAAVWALFFAALAFLLAMICAGME